LERYGRMSKFTVKAKKQDSLVPAWNKEWENY
jgi:hypothetical protein